MIVFTVGIFSCVTGIIRLSTIINIDMAHNTTFNITFASLWTDLEGHTALWVACFPAIQPLLRFISVKVGLTKKTSATSGLVYHTGGTTNSKSHASSHRHSLYKGTNPRITTRVAGGTWSQEHIVPYRVGSMGRDDGGIQMADLHDGDNGSESSIFSKEAPRPGDIIKTVQVSHHMESRY